MVKAENKFSIYAGPPLRAALDVLGGEYAENRSGRINTVCERYMAMVADELSRMSLSKGEWSALMDANNEVQVWAGDPGHALMIWANIHDTPGLSQKWDIDQGELVRKLQALPKATLFAVLEAIDRFWSHSELPTDEALAIAGIKNAAP